MLTGYDMFLSQYLVRGFTRGFIIPVNHNVKAVQSENHRSANQQATLIDEDLSVEISANRIAGPYDDPPINNMFISPIGMVPKKDPGQFRRIHDLSYPSGHSVNDYIPKHLCSVQYETLDVINNLVLTYGQGSYIAKADIEKAFRILPLNPISYNLMGFTWRGKYYYDRCLPMGCSISCNMFETFSTAIQWILCHQFGLHGVSHILDDFMFVGSSYEECDKKLNIFLSLAKWLNIPIKHSKTFRPSTVMVVHGIEVDTVAMEMRLPQDKLVKSRDQLQKLRISNKTTLRSLQSVIGLLNFACQAVAPGRAFLRRLISLTRGLTKPHHHIRMNIEAKADIQAWLTFLLSYNGSTLLRNERWLSSPTLHMYTDAAASKGYAAVLQSHWFAGLWPESWKSFSIAFLELFPICIALEIWSEKLSNQCIMFHTDNISIVSVINSNSSKDPALMFLVRRIVVTSLLHNIMFRAVHIPGHFNCTADMLSRSQVQQALQSNAHLSRTPMAIPEFLQPINIHPHKSWVRHWRTTQKLLTG